VAYSTVPQVKGALLVALQAVPGLAGVLIRRGLPGNPNVPELERIYIDNAVDMSREWMMLGRMRLDESYTIRVPVEVYQDGDDQAACEDRMWTIIALVEAVVIADTTLGGLLNGNTDRPSGMKPDGPDEQNSFATPEGWFSQAVLRIDCAARI
jgi:hypothetical protein